MTSLIHVNATGTCPHGGRATLIPAEPRVTLTGQVAGSVAGQWTVVGCVFTVGNKPQPCVTVRWVAPAARVKIGGSPVVTQASQGICQSAEQVPQGPPIVAVIQQRTRGL